ncbi:PQQ-binding-like beta-propeller repeat protein [bacterium]|nr:PQQ-binding-like beta-propeller repeat protein [bacterium]
MDTDADGLTDIKETVEHKTNPNEADTDGDDSTDGDEVTAGTDPNDARDFPIIVFAPVIIASLETEFSKYGDAVTFKVESRSVLITYQWFKNGKPIDGAKANLLHLFDVGDSDMAVYTVEAYNQAGKVVSIPAVLKIVKAAPIISELPSRFDLVYEADETINLNPKIETEGPTTFQWKKDGKELKGESEPILIIHDVKAADTGDYTLEVTNLVGTTVSETMRVSVLDESKIGLHVENNFKQTLGIIDSSPAVGKDGTVCYTTIGVLGNLYAHQPNGVRKWAQSFDSPMRGSQAIDGNGIIYVLEDEGALHAVSLAITEDNTIIFGWIDGTVYAMKDKEFIWEFPIEDSFYSSPLIGPDGTVYIGSSIGNLYALNSANGETVWSKPLASGGLMHTRPAIDANGDIYFCTYSRKFYALNKDQELKWYFDTDQDIGSSAVIRGDGTVYFGADDGRFYALDTETGEPKWAYKINRNFQLSASATLGLDGAIYFSLTDNKFYAISRIGKKYGRFD